MTNNVLCFWDGVDWRLRRQSTPPPYKEAVTNCHSERSEESIIFRQTTMINYFKTCESCNSYLKLCNNFEPDIPNFVSLKTPSRK